MSNKKFPCLNPRNEIIKWFITGIENLLLQFYFAFKSRGKNYFYSQIFDKKSTLINISNKIDNICNIDRNPTRLIILIYLIMTVLEMLLTLFQQIYYFISCYYELSTTICYVIYNLL